LPDPDDVSDRPLTEADVARMRKLVNVKKLRERLGMTQEAFAATYRIPVGTLRDWEQRRKHPDATARAYLHAIERDPQTIAGLLAA
jgi:putative transcriptional regulator